MDVDDAIDEKYYWTVQNNTLAHGLCLVGGIGDKKWSEYEEKKRVKCGECDSVYDDDTQTHAHLPIVNSETFWVQ